MKRVFTKWLGGGVSMNATGVLEWMNEVLEWTAQEPLSIIGAHLAIQISTPSENDAFQKLEAELSFSSTWGMDVAFLDCGSQAWWNTAPPGVDSDSDNVVAMFPTGYALSMKEGETMHLNTKVLAPPSAGVCIWAIKAHIYYVKGAAV